MTESLKRHWPEYLMEAAELGLFMVSACFFSALIFHPVSPVAQAISNPLLQRVLIGVAMGLTAIGIIYSPWGKQSGAHFNPAVTLTFYSLGKIAAWDAAFYMLAQFVGGVLGVVAAAAILGELVAKPPVQYAVTVPGSGGAGAAFLGEFVVAFLQMTMVLTVSNIPRLASRTGLFAGALVATYISIESPLSGMSMNPARTFASAFPAQLWTAFWVYFTAAPLAMLLASRVYVWRKSHVGVFCAKLHHQNDTRCIFCEHQEAREAVPAPQEAFQN